MLRVLECCFLVWLVSLYTTALKAQGRKPLLPDCFSHASHWQHELQGDWYTKPTRGKGTLGAENCWSATLGPAASATRCILSNPVAFAKDVSVQRSRDFIAQVGSSGFQFFQPRECNLRDFERQELLEVLENRTVLFLGDSTVAQQYVHLVGLLAGPLRDSTTMRGIFHDKVDPRDWGPPIATQPNLNMQIAPNTYPGTIQRVSSCPGETREMSTCTDVGRGIIVCWYSAGKDNSRTLAGGFRQALQAGLGRRDVIIASMGFHYAPLNPRRLVDEARQFEQQWASVPPQVRPITIYREAPPQMFKKGYFEKGERNCCTPYPEDVLSWSGSKRSDAFNVYNRHALPALQSSDIGAQMPVLRIWRATALLRAKDMRSPCGGTCQPDGSHQAITGPAHRHWNNLLVNMVSAIERGSSSALRLAQARHIKRSKRKRYRSLETIISGCGFPKGTVSMHGTTTADSEANVREAAFYGTDNVTTQFRWTDTA